MELESLLQAHMDVCIAIAVFSRTTKLDPLDILSQGQQKRRTMELESLLQAHMDVCIAIAVFSRTTKLDPLDILSQGQR